MRRIYYGKVRVIGMKTAMDIQLELLDTELIKMGALCEKSLKNAISALFENDNALIEKIEETEKEIDIKEHEIENLCTKILIREHPVARDLRAVSSALKMIGDMERIGDQTKDIAELSKTIAGEKLISEVHIKKMGALTSEMLINSIDAFVRGDIKLARSIEGCDDEVDKCFDVVKKELLEHLRERDAKEEVCLDALMVAKYLERIADHAVNISEWVIYAITGEK